MIKENKIMNILNVEKCNHSGTSFIGNYKVDYDKLVDTFGEPNFAQWYEDGNQTDSKSFVTWILEFETDDINNPLITVTIYDWKETNWKDVCNGEYDWHIGGYDDGLEVDVLAQYLEGGNDK